MSLLVPLVVVLAAGTVWLLVAEHRQQKRDTQVAAAVAPRGPEVCAVFVGGPCDGGRLRVSPGVAQRITVHMSLPDTVGVYARTGEVVMPDGGAVLTFEWEAAA